MPTDVLLGRLERLVGERDSANGAIDDVLAAVETEGRDPSDAERDLVARYRSRLDELEPQIVDAVADVERRQAARDASALIRAGSTSPVLAPAGDVVPTAPAGDAVPVYRTFAEYARDALICRFDMIAGAAGGRAIRDAAGERLERAVVHTTTADVPGLLPPQHISQIMQLISRRRPLVEATRRLALSAGKITYPRITSKPTVGKQPAEKQEGASTELTVIMVEKVAVTFLGAGNLSWQTIQWSTPDALALWFDLAAEDYARKTEAETGAIFGAGFDTPPVAVASDDLAGWMGAITAAAGQVYAATGRTANVIAAAPDVGFALLGLVGATSPVFLSTGGGNLQTQTATIAGLRLVITAGLAPGTVVVGDFDAILTAETAGAPVELRAVEPSIGGLEVGVIGAFLVELVEEAAFVPLTPPVGGAARAGSTTTTTASAPASSGK